MTMQADSGSRGQAPLAGSTKTRSYSDASPPTLSPSMQARLPFRSLREWGELLQRHSGSGPTNPHWKPAIGAPVAIRVSPRARRIGLRIDAAERRVELVLPRGVSARTGLRFLATKRGWVEARLEALPQPVPFVEGAIVPVLGVSHRIRCEFDLTAPPVRIIDGEIRVHDDPLHLARRVRNHLLGMAQTEISSRAYRLAASIGREVARVSVRDTKSRWGSCSRQGNLSFCWRLILAPESVLDQVVAHEVAHLVEMNHGPRFWRLVESLAPGGAGARAWLKQHRAQLLSYG
jgi:predicted metal-dependent hydrolase